jgi:hypothetical protein
VRGRIWVYLRRSTLGLALRALSLRHKREADDMEAAADDLRQAERLSASGADREAIERAADAADDKQGGP